MDCGCGRSPNGKCLGWHDLSEEEYKEKLKEYEAIKKSKIKVFTETNLDYPNECFGAVIS